MQKGKNSVNEQVKESVISSTRRFLDELIKIFVIIPAMFPNILIIYGKLANESLIVIIMKGYLCCFNSSATFLLLIIIVKELNNYVF